MNTDTINSSIRPQKELLLQHPLYSKIKTVEDLRHFLEGHVYAVWDFMSLVKALQSRLTCTGTPWLPVGRPDTRYFINEIVLAEETDANAEGQRQSHYEMYLDAMKACGADTSEIELFIEDVVTTQNIFVSIKHSRLHNDIKAFLDYTFRLIDQGKPHEIAAAFTFARKDLIPEALLEVIGNLQVRFPEAGLEKIAYCFKRHTILDAGARGPMALQMVAELCGTDSAKWKEAEETALQALEKRVALWNAIEENMMHHDLASI